MNRRDRHSPLRLRSPLRVTRRQVVAGATAMASSLTAKRLLAQPGATCQITPDSGEGPFYFDPGLLRADVTEAAAGAPLDIAIRITAARDCSPIAGIRLDLWQADGLGLYSGYRDQPGVGEPSDPAVDRTYLRGTQFADSDGYVRFKTIYPSWYGGRTPHIHFKVLRDSGELVASQIFFDDEVNAEVFANWDPYREFVDRRTVFNHNDRFLDADNDQQIDGVFCTIDRYDSTGLTAQATITIDDV